METNIDYKALYEEARKRAKHVKFTDTKENVAAAEYIFPDLKENDDERIRKKLIGIFTNKSLCDVYNLKSEDVLAYLERQKEQEFAPKTFEDAVKQMYDEVDVCQLKWKERAAKLFELAKKELEQKPVEWSDEDSVKPKFKPGMANVLKSLRPQKKEDEK